MNAYVLSNVSNYTLIWVKYAGGSDITQVLAYAGNSVSVAAHVAIPTVSYVGSVATPSVGSYDYNFTISFPYYKSGSYSIACEYYYKYNQNLSNKDYHYVVRAYNLVVLDGYSVSIVVLVVSYGF